MISPKACADNFNRCYAVVIDTTQTNYDRAVALEQARVFYRCLNGTTLAVRSFDEYLIPSIRTIDTSNLSNQEVDNTTGDLLSVNPIRRFFYNILYK